MARIGFYQPQGSLRCAIYSFTGEKLAYLKGNELRDLEGRLIARILRYHVDLPELRDMGSMHYLTLTDLSHEV